MSPISAIVVRPVRSQDVPAAQASLESSRSPCVTRVSRSLASTRTSARSSTSPTLTASRCRCTSGDRTLTGVLRDREFLRYFLSRQLSVAGSIVTLVTLPIIVYRTSGSASLTALVAACEAAAVPALRALLRRTHRPLEPQEGDGHRRHAQRAAGRDRSAGGPALGA